MADTAASINPAQSSRSLPAMILTGLIITFLDVVFAVSMASLMFSGPLASDLSRGIGIVLMTALVHAVFTVLFSAAGGLVSIVQDGPAVILSVATASLAGMLAVGEQRFATIIGLIFAATVLTGVFMLLLGTFRMGGLVRYIPYPVIGGFLAGMGWLLTQGSIGTMASYPLTLATLPELLTPAQIAIWLPGVLLGVAIFAGLKRYKHALTMPAILGMWLVLFFAVLFLTGGSIPWALEQGLLVGSVSQQSVWSPPLEIVRADWGAVFSQVGSLGAIMIISAIDLLLYISALEVTLRRDIDFNRELRAMGAANLISAGLGGMVGYYSLSFTSLASRMRSSARLTAIIMALAYALILVVGTSLLAYTPRALIGGTLLGLGLDFLYEWVVGGRRKLNRMDYSVLLLILLTIAVFGYLAGVTLGLVVMIVLFVVRYSRLSIFRRAVSGAEISSHVQRNGHHQRVLVSMGQQIYVLELEGFLFFGTANLVLERVRERLDSPNQKALAFLVLDFRRVTGLDSSAALNFTKVHTLAGAQGFSMVLTSLTEAMQADLARNGLTPGDNLWFSPDLDRGLEWCENILLDRNQVTKQHMPANIELQLKDYGFRREDAARLKTYMQRIQFQRGERLMTQGDPADSLYFIEVGKVSVFVTLENGREVRLQTMTMGTLVGELGFFQGGQRTASVIADENTIAYRLERGRLDELAAQEPNLAIALHQLVVRIIADRLRATNRELMALNL